MRLRSVSEAWGLLRRTLALGRSVGSLFYLISIGLIAGWIIAVFFGVGLFFLMPRSAKLEPGLSPAGASFDTFSAQTPWLTQSMSRLNRLSTQPTPEPSQPMADAAGNVSPREKPAEATIAHTADQPAGQAFSAELGTISAATGETAPMPAPHSQLSTAPEPRSASQSSRSPSSRKPLKRGPSKTRTAHRHAPVSAIQGVLHRHPRLLK